MLGALPKVIVIHNSYRESGGEDAVYRSEASLLKQKGLLAGQFDVSNLELGNPLSAALNSIWSSGSYALIRKLLKDHRADILHVHNTLARFSPSVYYAARAENVAVVQTLHNYRLACPAGTFTRNGKPCVKCESRYFQWPAVVHGCYRDSRIASGMVAAITGVHRVMKTWNDQVDAYVALSEFSKKHFVAAGLPPERIVVRPNFVDRDWGMDAKTSRTGFIYIGRLSREKGIDLFVRAVKRLSEPVPVTIVGDGPMRDFVRAEVGSMPNVAIKGQITDKEEIMRMLGAARFIVIPSRAFENCPMALLEAFSVGTPAIVSDHGALPDFVRDGIDGYHFRGGDDIGLAEVMARAAGTSDPSGRMNCAVRSEFDGKFNAEVGFRSLLKVYERARLSLAEVRAQ